jgi:P pilus assembly chaperone PapD
MNKPTSSNAFLHYIKNKHNLFFITLLLLLSCGFSIKSSAQGNLMVMPKRVLFESSKKSQELNLVNTGKDTCRYVISLIQMRMKEDGTFERITEPDADQKFADKNVRLFPRTVTLPPNESQVVKVQLTRSNELAEGEYRSHIYFRAVPKDNPLGEPQPEKDTSISIKLTPVFGISIPVIIRVGQSTSKVRLSYVSFQKLKDNHPSLKLTFNRSGNMSVYGDISIDFISPDGHVIQVANNRGVAVYTPNLKRNCIVLLDNNKGVDYSKGKLHVVYSEQLNGRQSRMAEEEIVLQ